MSRVDRRIRVTGARREVIDTDQLAALLLRVARRVARERDQADAGGAAAPDSDSGDGEGATA
ncbi:hypothetical protein GCM10009830_05560 [Glycomyces endophyticus]|uniref:Uncharacterized protein n=2 Tax=Glycomyces endophyticus TaxID=480996 RepID=A0ABP4RYR3_9ACTN